MFYERVKKGWEAGEVRVSLAVIDQTRSSGAAPLVFVTGSGLMILMTLFLSRKERQLLVDHNKCEAQAVKARFENGAITIRS